MGHRQGNFEVYSTYSSVMSESVHIVPEIQGFTLFPGSF